MKIIIKDNSKSILHVHTMTYLEETTLTNIKIIQKYDRLPTKY